LTKLFTNPKCPECGRVFDMWNDVDSAEWSAGHDCEPPEPERQTAQLMFLANGTKVIVAARSDVDSADRHAVNGDLLAWGDYNEMMLADQEGSK
jgi:hypothetical protein